MAATDTENQPHPLDALIPDPEGQPPLCDEPGFAKLVETMVADDAPRMFAVVQEYGERVDARIAAWGMAFDDRAAAFAVRGGSSLSLESPDRVARLFRIGTRVRSRLVWVNPEAATPPADDDSEQKCSEVE